MYIVIEGMSGSGKTTQIDLLASLMCDYKIKTVVLKSLSTDVPGGMLLEKLGKGSCLTHIEEEELALTSAIDMLTRRDIVMNAKNSYSDLLLSERSYLTSIAYGRGEEYTQWVYDVNRYTPRSDLTIILDVDEETAVNRCGGSKLLGTMKRLHNVRAKYHELSETLDNVVLVDANDSIPAVNERVKRVILDQLELNMDE